MDYFNLGHSNVRSLYLVSTVCPGACATFKGSSGEGPSKDVSARERGQAAVGRDCWESCDYWQPRSVEEPLPSLPIVIHLQVVQWIGGNNVGHLQISTVLFCYSVNDLAASLKLYFFAVFRVLYCRCFLRGGTSSHTQDIMNFWQQQQPCLFPFLHFYQLNHENLIFLE